jgi:hypothetical protein
MPATVQPDGTTEDCQCSSARPDTISLVLEAVEQLAAFLRLIFGHSWMMARLAVRSPHPMAPWEHSQLLSHDETGDVERDLDGFGGVDPEGAVKVAFLTHEGDTRIAPSRALQDMTTSARSVTAAVVSVSVLLASCGLAAPKADVSPRRDTRDVSLITPVSNKSSRRRPTDRQVAVADAHHLLALSRSPGGATPLSTTPPPGTTTIMREPPSYPGTPYLIELARYSIVPGSPSAALAWFLQHAPTGSTVAGSSQASGPSPADDEASQDFGWPTTQALNSRQLIVTAQAFGARTLLRFDSQVVYWPDLPAGEHIPAGVDSIVLTVTTATGNMKVMTQTRSFVITRPSEIAAFVRTEATLRPPIMLMNPGGPCIGVAQAAEHYLAKLFVRGETNPAVTIVGQAANVGTGDVTFSSGGRTYPVLEDWSHLLTVVEQLTGEHFTLGC